MDLGLRSTKMGREGSVFMDLQLAPRQPRLPGQPPCAHPTSPEAAVPFTWVSR